MKIKQVLSIVIYNYLVAVKLLNLKGFTELGWRNTQYNINSKRDILRAKLTDIKRKIEAIGDLKKRNRLTSVFGTLDSIVRTIKADKACFYVTILLEKRGVKLF